MPVRDRRKLTAVLAADVVGYSRLMEADEAGTLGRLRTLRKTVIDPEIDGHGGRIVKTTGDGILAEFPSAVDALHCALSIQRGAAAAAAGEAADQAICYRIGLNVGDVIVEDDDIFGDVVNIAARLEQMAPPGGICLSQAVHDYVRGKIPVELEDGGPCELRNIARPVRVWRWPAAAADGETGAAVTATGPDAAFGRWRPTIAVLPFDNMSRDPDEDYFADGLTEDLITALTHWRSFPVVARNSTFTYKGRASNVPEVARELGANYVLEGSVRRAGKRVRVTAQLIDGASGHHVWAERYDRDLDDIFELQDELTHRIAAVVAPELSRAELKRSSQKRPNDLDAWDHVLRGDALLEKDAQEDLSAARRHYEAAIALDPDYSDAFTGLSQTYNREIRMLATEDREETLRQAIAAAQRAVEADPQSSQAHFALSTAYILENRHDLALAEAELSVELNPNDPHLLQALGNKSDLAGDPEGIARMEVAQQLNPRDPLRHMHLTYLARAYAKDGDNDKAIAKAREALQLRPLYAPADYILAIALAHAGRREEAAEAIRRCEAASPGFIGRRAHWKPYTDEAANARLRDGLAKAMAAAGLS